MDYFRLLVRGYESRSREIAITKLHAREEQIEKEALIQGRE
ncbi:hypothetical protein Goklo_022687 [Gossypium klotzschianum]|uniref:Uncharacterized protein n=1 Tax=Gossypium klotzschianum TaxID=34286 RepID=A0A7J8TN53_9ROSI|nr:hypothetical protein [Gossypium klotzschianum]